jgi:glycosyltransferase involved in cell wall biosynthesis
VRPLHVAVALGGTDLGRSGIGTYVREVLPPLIAQLGQEGGRLTAFGHDSELAAFRAALAGAGTRPSPATAAYPGLNAFWHLARSAHFARELKADVLLLPAANRRLSARAALPTVAVVHDLAQLRVQGKYDRLRMFYFHHVLLRALRTPTRLVAVSRATRDDIVRAVGVPEHRVDVVYNGVNTADFSRADPHGESVQRVRRECRLAARPYLLYPARLEHPGKNHVRLLHAFARSGLAKTHTLALSGGDWGAAALIEKTIRDLRLENDVVMLGFLPVAQLRALVTGADAVLMLGLHEGFGLPALEALSAGRPVCVSSTGALPEVVGELGVQCDPFDETAIADALQRVLREPTIRQRCEVEGPAWARRFTWENTARGLMNACHAAVNAS